MNTLSLSDAAEKHHQLNALLLAMRMTVTRLDESDAEALVDLAIALAFPLGDVLAGEAQA